MRDMSLEMNDNVFDHYWINVYFFYLGLKKDCPTEIRAILGTSRRSPSARPG